jgi:hypothetical protein
MATITSIASGDWFSPSTWGSGAIPSITDEVVIAHGITCYSLTPQTMNCTVLKFTNASAANLLVAGSDHILNGSIDFRLPVGSGFLSAARHISVASNTAGYLQDTSLTCNGNIYPPNIYYASHANSTEISVATDLSTTTMKSSKFILNGSVICESIMNQSSTTYGGYVFGLINFGKLEINGNYTSEDPIYDMPYALVKATATSSAIDASTVEILINGNIVGGGRMQLSTSSSTDPEASVIMINGPSAIITINGKIIPSKLRHYNTSTIHGMIVCTSCSMTINMPNGMEIPFVREIPIIAARNNYSYYDATIGDHKTTLNIGSPGITCTNELRYSGANAIEISGVSEINCNGGIHGSFPTKAVIYQSAPRTVPSNININGDVVGTDGHYGVVIQMTNTGTATNIMNLTITGNVISKTSGYYGTIALLNIINSVVVNGNILKNPATNVAYSTIGGSAFSLTTYCQEFSVSGHIDPGVIYGIIDGPGVGAGKLASSGTIEEVRGSNIPWISDHEPLCSSLALGMRLNSYGGTINKVKYGTSNYNPIGCDWTPTSATEITLYEDDGTPIVLTSAGNLPAKKRIRKGVLDGTLSNPDPKYVLSSSQSGTGTIPSPCVDAPLEILE